MYWRWELEQDSLASFVPSRAQIGYEILLGLVHYADLDIGGNHRLSRWRSYRQSEVQCSALQASPAI